MHGIRHQQPPWHNDMPFRGGRQPTGQQEDSRRIYGKQKYVSCAKAAPRHTLRQTASSCPTHSGCQANSTHLEADRQSTVVQAPSQIPQAEQLYCHASNGLSPHSYWQAKQSTGVIASTTVAEIIMPDFSPFRSTEQTKHTASLPYQCRLRT
mmetsp:Transcript_26007/g.41267  ORF Transcript_26007/g.41267 Transcript_26007/m.41267 type:complete len:152 (+) Transcript_26007:138-593(+)